MDGFRPELQTCPWCGTKGSCRIHAYYDRSLVDFMGGAPVRHSLCIPESPAYPAHLLGFRLYLCPPFCQVLPPVPQQSGALLPAGLRPMSRFPAATRHGYGLYPDASRNAYYRRITQDPLTLPDGSVFRYSPKTISKWVSLYQNGGIDALMPQERSDKGATRVLPDTAIEEIYRLKKAFPRLNSTQIHRHLVEEAFIPASVSVCAVQRFVKKHDLKSARNPNLRDRKAFEEDAFGKMWQADYSDVLVIPIVCKAAKICLWQPRNYRNNFLPVQPSPQYWRSISSSEPSGAASVI